MGWLRENLHWVLLLAFVLTTASVVGLGIVAVLSVLAAIASGGPIFAVAFEAMIPYVLPLLLLGALDVVFLVAGFWVGIRKFFAALLSLVPDVRIRSERRAAWARHVESEIPPVRRLGLSKWFEPTVKQRRDDLKERYVNGEIGVFEFEQRMADLVDGDPGSPRGDGDAGDRTAPEAGDGRGTDREADEGDPPSVGKPDRGRVDRDGDRRDRDDEFDDFELEVS